MGLYVFKISNLPEVAKFKASVGRASVVETLYPLSPQAFLSALQLPLDDVYCSDPHTDKIFTAAIIKSPFFSRWLS